MKLDWNSLEKGERIILGDRGITLDRKDYSEIKFVVMDGNTPLGLESQYSDECVSATFPPSLPAGEYVVCVRGIATDLNMKKEKLSLMFEIFLPVYVPNSSVEGVFLSKNDYDILMGLAPEENQVLICADEQGNLIKKNVVNGEVGEVNIDLLIEEIQKQSQEEDENLDKRLKTVEDELADLLYKAPTTSLRLLGSISDVDLSTDNRIRSVTGFSHHETNLQNIEGTLSFKQGGNELLSNIVKKDSETQVNLTNAMAMTFTAVETIPFTLSGVSIKGVGFSASASISAYYPAFYASSANRPVELSAFTKVRSLSGTRTVTVSGEPKYIWFCTTGSISKITSAGFDVPFEQDGTLNYKGGNYKLYRTSNEIVAGTYSYTLS